MPCRPEAPVWSAEEESLHPSLGAEVAGVDLSHSIDSLKTFNSLDSGRTDTRQEDRDKYGKPIEHPMVRTHPVHGSRAVYFHISKATHIDGMTPEVSPHEWTRRSTEPGSQRVPVQGSFQVTATSCTSFRAVL